MFCVCGFVLHMYHRAWFQDTNGADEVTLTWAGALPCVLNTYKGHVDFGTDASSDSGADAGAGAGAGPGAGASAAGVEASADMGHPPVAVSVMDEPVPHYKPDDLVLWVPSTGTVGDMLALMRQRVRVLTRVSERSHCVSFTGA